MFRLITIILISVCALSACAPDKRVSFVNTGVIAQIPVETVQECLNADPNYYLGLISCGDYYIASYYKDSLFFGILDSEFQTVHRMVRRGRGPDEYLAPVIPGQCRQLDSSRLTFSLLERPKGLFEDMDADCPSGAIRVLNSRRFPIEMQDMRILFRTPYGFFGVLDDEQQRVFTCDTALTSIIWHKRIAVKRDYPGQMNNRQSLGCISPDSLNIAFAYLNQPRIDFWKASGQAVRTLVFSDLQGELLDICCDQDSVFLLYESQDGDNRELLRLDWEGQVRHRSDIRSASVICLKKDALITLRHTDEGAVFSKLVFGF